ncbi:MAG: lipopolysaccharide heptosyltransferase II [Myxococcota bacterium]|jgi:heptosyltransferase-2|nr:lipopolysaccharide heptosyltransferase II [Myxococcota bacterium]
MIELARVQKVLVRAPNWLGDLVMATPGLRALRAGCPNAHIVVWVREGLEPVLAGSPDVDQVFTLPGAGARWSDRMESVRRVREAGPYDLGLCLPDSVSSALLMRLAGGRPLFGYSNAARQLLLDRPIPIGAGGPDARRAPREDRIQGLLTNLGIATQGLAPRLVTTVAEKKKIEEFLRSSGPKVDRGLWVGLAPGAAYGPAKCWPAGRYAALGDALAMKEGAAIFIVGGPGERELCGTVARRMTAPCVNLSGALDLGAAKALIQRLNLMICNDSGARHLAIGLQVPALVFFGPTDVSRTRRNLQNVSILENKDVACRPCYHRDCPTHHQCLLDLTVQEALDEARSRLALGWSDPARRREDPM